jgi:putative hydrolase of the HAD superfamily
MDHVIVLDVDDTLYLERDYVRSGFEAVAGYLAERGIDGFATAAWQMFLEGVRGDTFDRALCALGVAPKRTLVRKLVEMYRHHEPSIRLESDARALLKELREEGYDTAAVTDGPPSSQRRKLAALGLDDALAFIVVTGEHGPHWTKPSQRPFRAVEKEFGVERKYVYVADNPRKDFAGPAALGWRTYRVRRPGALHHDLPSGWDVDYEAVDLHGLASWLDLGSPA